MIVGVADTHTAIWHLFNDSRISKNVKNFMDEVAEKGKNIALSSISLVDIVYLSEKSRIAASVYNHVVESLANSSIALVEAPLTSEIVDVMHMISRDAVPDMPDRIIAATALHFNVPLLTRDGRIRATNLHTIW